MENPTSHAGVTPAPTRHGQKIRLLTAAAAAALLAVPGAALAKGGPDAPAPAPAPAPGTACVTATPLNSGEVDRPSSRKRVTVDVQLRNCGAGTVTVTDRLVGTSSTVTSYDPYTVLTCSTDPYAIPGATLRPGESKVVSGASTVPYCGYSPWGITASYDVEYAFTATDAATGAVVATTTSVVAHRGGN